MIRISEISCGFEITAVPPTNPWFIVKHTTSANFWESFPYPDKFALFLIVFLLSPIQNLNFLKNIKHPHLECFLTKSWMSLETLLSNWYYRRRKFHEEKVFTEEYSNPCMVQLYVRRKFLLAYFRGFTAIGASFRNFENQFASLGMDVLNRDTTRNFLVFSFRYQSPDTPLEFYHASMCRNLIDIFDLNWVSNIVIWMSWKFLLSYCKT